MSIQEKLKSLLEGNLLLEAEKDKYDLDQETGDNSNDDETPAADDQNQDEGGDNQQDDDNQDNEDDEPDYSLDEDNDESENQDDSQPSTSDSVDNDDQSGNDQNTSFDSQQQKPGNLLELDEKSRAILMYKNFQKYRSLRDDTKRLMTELTEFVPTNEQVRENLLIAIEKSGNLIKKLDDYIQYKYNDNSYEINYHNYMHFLLEKMLLEQLYQNIKQMSLENNKK